MMKDKARDIGIYPTGILLFLIILSTGLFYSCKKHVDRVYTAPPPPAPPVTLPPGPSSVNFHLLPVGNLSKARINIIAGAAGSKILFAGGRIGKDCFIPGGDYGDSIASICISESNRVDIYDTATHTWLTHDLARYYYGSLRAVTVGSKVFFSEGLDTSTRLFSDKLDVYDASTNAWSVIQGGPARFGCGAGSLGSKVFIAGGINYGNAQKILFDRVDIYDVASNTWSSATLSEARAGATVNSIGNKIIFAGGGYGGWQPVSGTIDLYDNSTNMWTVSALSEARSGSSGVVIGNKAFFVGGRTGFRTPSARVMDIFDNTVNSWSVKTIDFFGEEMPSVVIGNRAFFFVGRSVQIFDGSTGVWSQGSLDRDLGYTAIIAVGNTIYFAGGGTDVGGQLSAVWKLEF